MNNQNNYQPKKKLSVSISSHNINKINRILIDNKRETTSSVIDHSLDMSLEEVASLLKNPLDLQKKKLELQIEDIMRMKKEQKIEEMVKRISGKPKSEKKKGGTKKNHN